MSPKYRTCAICLLTALISLACILALWKRPAPVGTVALVLVSRGTSQEYALFTAFVTNTSIRDVSLGWNPYVQYEDRTGLVVIDAGKSWEGKGASLRPGEVGEVRFGIPADYRKVRIYTRVRSDAGRLPRLASRSVGRFTPRQISPGGIWKWLYSRGWLTGMREELCSSSWTPNPSQAVQRTEGSRARQGL